MFRWLLRRDRALSAPGTVRYSAGGVSCLSVATLLSFTGPEHVIDPDTERETEARGKCYTQRSQGSLRPLSPSLSPAWSPADQSCAPHWLSSDIVMENSPGQYQQSWSWLLCSLPLSIYLLLDSWAALPKQLVFTGAGKLRHRSQADTRQC